MKTEKALIAVALLGMAFYLMNWPGHAILMLLGLGGLSIIYFPGGFYFLRIGETSTREIIVSILAGMVFSVVVMGILFKMMFWPGRTVMLSSGVLFLVAILAVLVLLRPKNNEGATQFYISMLIRAMALLMLCSFFYLLDSYTLLKVHHRDDPEMARLKYEMYSDFDNEEKHRRYDAYVQYKDSLQLLEYKKK